MTEARSVILRESVTEESPRSFVGSLLLSRRDLRDDE